MEQFGRTNQRHLYTTNLNTNISSHVWAQAYNWEGLLLQGWSRGRSESWLSADGLNLDAFMVQVPWCLQGPSALKTLVSQVFLSPWDNWKAVSNFLIDLWKVRLHLKSPIWSQSKCLRKHPSTLPVDSGQTRAPDVFGDGGWKSSHTPLLPPGGGSRFGFKC